MEEVERYEPDARLLWLASYLGACINRGSYSSIKVSLLPPAQPDPCLPQES